MSQANRSNRRIHRFILCNSFSNRFWNLRSISNQHIQSGHCKSDNPVPTIKEFQFHTSGIHVKLTRNQSIHKKPPFYGMLYHPKIFECFSDCFLFFRWTQRLSGIFGLRQIVVLTNLNPTFPLNL